MTRRATDGSPIKRPTLSTNQCYTIAWEMGRRYIEQLHHADYHRILGFSDDTEAEREAEIASAERKAADYFAIIAKVTPYSDAHDLAMVVAEIERNEWRHKVREWTEIAERRRARAAA